MDVIPSHTKSVQVSLQQKMDKTKKQKIFDHPLKKMDKILIIGDAGRGKTTFAKKLSKKLKIKYYSTDNYFWEKKFSKKRDREQSSFLLKKTLKNKNRWILEGTTTRLITPQMNNADTIIWLKHKFLTSQIIIILKRHKVRGGETKKELFKFMLYLIKIRFHKRNKKIRGLIENNKDKVIILNSFKKIDEFVKNAK